MTQKEIKDKIADWENRLKNPSVAGVPSAVTKINSEIAQLEAMLEKEEKPKTEKKEKVAKKSDLEKELSKLQRELNSTRLSTYIEGDNSDEAKANRKEREVKLARFNEVLALLNKEEPKKELSNDKLKEIRAEYQKNEDDNAHSENTVLLAKYFGTKAELEKANDILEKHNKLGSIPESLNDERYELHKKLYKKFVDLEGKGTKETKAEEKAEHKKDAYNCDDLVKEAKERHAKAKAAAEARANAPKKSEATKDKEKIEKVHETVEKQLEKGKLNKSQLEKLIQETKDLLKLLEKALKNL